MAKKEGRCGWDDVMLLRTAVVAILCLCEHLYLIIGLTHMY